MKREELLKAIDMAVRLEEDANYGLAEDIISTMNWSSFSDKEKKIVVKFLNKLTKETKIHKKILINLKERIEEEDRNVY